MSRFTTPIFNRPKLSLEQIKPPTLPISPPETDSERFASAPEHRDSSPPTEVPRKVSTLAYRHTGVVQDSHGRHRSSSKWLVLVLPPALVLETNGELGHTLATSPPSRLAQGILMPLFPTMYAQLAAIAKEFNFPSTTGLCLYMHIDQGSGSFMPRISEEAWSILWTHYFDGVHEGSAVFPICGHLDFDIDLRKAIWFDAYKSNSQREISRGLSISTESHVTSTSDADADNYGRQNRNKASKHIPKKLSLVDATSMRSKPPAYSQGTNHGPLAAQESVRHENSRIVQDRVEGWIQASDHLSQNADMGNNPDPDHGTVQLTPIPFNPDEYAYSISSHGPPSPLESWISEERADSIHLDRRVRGSVCNTPSICTSWGPEDYDPLSPLSISSWVPTPDIAKRMFDDVPLTPSTATTWGAPLSWPPSPVIASHVNTPDAAQMTFDFILENPDLVPLFQRMRVRTTKDLAFENQHLRAEYPNIVIYPAVYPYFNIYPSQLIRLDDKPPTFSSQVNYPALNIYPAVYPHFDLYPSAGCFYDKEVPPVPQRTLPTTLASFSYPHLVIYPALKENTKHVRVYEVQLGPISSYPNVVVYPPAYPYFDIYPSMKSLCQGDWQPQLTIPSRLSHTNPIAFYPAVVPYPPVYPHFEIYPSIPLPFQLTSSETTKQFSTKLPTYYPRIEPYPAVYPYLEIYPVGSSLQQPVLIQKAKHTSGYPYLQLYESVYPHFDLYPRRAGDSATKKPRYTPKKTHHQLHMEVFSKWSDTITKFPEPRPSNTPADAFTVIPPSTVSNMRPRRPSVALRTQEVVGLRSSMKTSPTQVKVSMPASSISPVRRSVSFRTQGTVNKSPDEEKVAEVSQTLGRRRSLLISERMKAFDSGR